MTASPRRLEEAPTRYAQAFSAAEAFGALDEVLWRPVDRGTVASPRLDWVSFTANDATKFPIPAGSFDLVQCVLGIFFFPDMEAGTRSLIRQTRPGGRTALSIWRRGAISPIGECLKEALSPFKPHLGEESRDQVGTLLNRINTAPTYADWLQDLGLEQVRIDVHEHRIELDERSAWALVPGSAFRAMLDGLGPAQMTEVRHRYLDVLEQRKTTPIDASTLVGIGKVPQ
ncbi:class I SAM-dependent methyltransferase [Arthrobacter sp. H41]|uniref:class I SAM-dependent methyltransferase n=1 Tax=Arthrobacter sp. H41 TaxID=1312978 RepID=UPI0004B399EC|nr:methyltransferase domain-containing protein [Arthrobacter sp. H41]